MYWYYKYPLYLILALMVAGLGLLIYKQLPHDVKEGVAIGTGNQPPAAADAPPDAGTAAVGATLNAPGTAAGSRSAPNPLVARQLRAAREQLGSDNLLAARTLVCKVLDDQAVQAFSNAWTEAVDILNQVNTKLLNSDAPAPEKELYEIKSGDTLVEIARRYRTTVEALQRGNRLNPDSAKIFPGMILHIYRGDWRIVVDKEHFKLLLYDKDRIFKVYDVAVGRQDRTPAGTFKIVNRLREPAWTPPGRIIPYGHPENVLGTRWMGIAATGETDSALKGYGIHGTWEPQTVGTQASEGCIRMRNEDVEELFDIVPPGTPVTIKD